MKLNLEILDQFERGLNPRHLEASAVPARLLGYGEISAIFEIQGMEGLAVKRMPLFSTHIQASLYEEQYHQYCGLLAEAGLVLPETATAVVSAPNRPVSLYITQAMFPKKALGNAIIQKADPQKARQAADEVVAELEKIWQFNQENRPGLELAIDGQISNWARTPDGGWGYLDTSTPLVRKNGVEQLDPELLLAAVPSAIKPLVRLLFLDDVMNRYYEPGQVYTDLAANLYKEQRPDLVKIFVDAANQGSAFLDQPLSVAEIQKYYRWDKIIWQTFLALRKVDRWTGEKFHRRRYEFILPGKIKR